MSAKVFWPCSRNPATLEKSNKLAARVAELTQSPEVATLVAIRALTLAEGACARYGEAEKVLRDQLARQLASHPRAAARDDCNLALCAHVFLPTEKVSAGP